MTSIKCCYVELLHLTQLFLLREHSLKEMKKVDPIVLTFFQKKMKSSLPLPTAKKVEQPRPTPLLPTQNTKTTSIPPSPNLRPAEPKPPPPTQPEPLPSPAQTKPLVPAPPPPPIQDKSNKNKSFALEPLTPAAPSRDYRELWKICQTLFPEWPLCETIPSDALAQKNKNAWLSDQVIPPVIILSFQDEEKQLTFLKNIAQAISLRLAPAKVLSALKLEKENGWENLLSTSHLRLVIASDYGLYLQSKLMSFYREEPQQSKHFLNRTPLLLLSDLSLYLKEPQLKPLLWRAICNEFTASQLQHSKNL